MSFFSFPFLPILVLLFIPIFATALVFAAPLNLFILPVAFHLLREHPERAWWLGIAGFLGGIRPRRRSRYWRCVRWTSRFPWPWTHFRSNFGEPIAIAVFSVIGSIAGLVCARLHKPATRRRSSISTDSWTPCGSNNRHQRVYRWYRRRDTVTPCCEPTLRDNWCGEVRKCGSGGRPVCLVWRSRWRARARARRRSPTTKARPSVSLSVSASPAASANMPARSPSTTAATSPAIPISSCRACPAPAG